MRIFVSSDELDFYSVGFRGHTPVSLQVVLPYPKSWTELLPSLRHEDPLEIEIDKTMLFEGKIVTIMGTRLEIYGKLLTEERTLWDWSKVEA